MQSTSNAIKREAPYSTSQQVFVACNFGVLLLVAVLAGIAVAQSSQTLHLVKEFIGDNATIAEHALHKRELRTHILKQLHT